MVWRLAGAGWGDVIDNLDVHNARRADLERDSSPKECSIDYAIAELPPRKLVAGTLRWPLLDMLKLELPARV